jgi:tetratricopeptide (TPR) repeat protein
VLQPLVNDAAKSTTVPGEVGAGPADAANKYYLALAYLGERRYQDALTVLDQLVTVREPAELVDGVHVARASALMGLERFAEAVEPLQTYLASSTRGADVDRCRAQLAVALARLDRWSELEPVVAQLRGSQADTEL